MSPRKKKNGNAADPQQISTNRYPNKSELPPPLELAKLAALLHRNSGNDFGEAILKAVQLYRKVVYLHEIIESYPAEELRVQMEDFDTGRVYMIDGVPIPFGYSQRRAPVPNPKNGFTATLDDFLEAFVKTHPPADAAKRLRDFFRSRCPTGQDELDYASHEIEKIKANGFDSLRWLNLGVLYSNWWDECPLGWRNPENKAMCRLYTRQNADFLNESLWPQQFEWLRQRLEKMHTVFAPIVKKLKIEPGE